MKAKARERKQASIVESLRLGVSILAACVAAGIGRATFYRWLSDEDFEEAVMTARMGVVQEAMKELWKQATGYYVEEEKVVETVSGPRKQVRTRWVSGKVSAVNAILRMMEKDGKELAKFLGTTEDTEGTEKRECDHDYEHDCDELGDLEPRMDTNEQEWKGESLSHFEGELRGEELTTEGSEGEMVESQMDTDEHRFDGARLATGEDQGDVSRFEGETDARQATGAPRLSRRERRALEREAYRAAKKARKAAARG